MPEYVTRDEFEARVGVLEREVDGEKLVTRHILEQTRRNGDDLAAIKTRLDRVERKVDGLEQRFGGLEQKVGGLEQKVGGLEQKVGGLERKVDGLIRDLPAIVGDVVREVFRERDRQT